MVNPAVFRVIESAMFTVVVGWACLWVLKPTKLWKNPWNSAEKSMEKTFLGDYGLDILVFSYPVLLLSILGYVYQHLLQRVRRTRDRRTRLPCISLSNPVIVRTPVGVISRGEILGAALFASLLVWTIYRYISNDLQKLQPQKALQKSRFQLKAMRVGIRFGSLAEICMAVLFLPILRGMSVLKIIGIQFEASVRYHVWIANILVLFSVLHGFTIMFLWADNHIFWNEIKKWQRTGRVNLAGAITLATGIAIWITSLPAIRRKKFHLFYSAHHLYIIFITFYLFHCGDSHFYFVLPGILLFALDKILRFLQSKPTQCLILARLLPCRAIELTLSKHPSVKYNPTSVLFLNVPSISRTQWHPFSVVTATGIDSDRFTMIIKCHGWWTTRLHDRIRSMIESDDCSKCLSFGIEGPYGPTESLIERYDSLVLVAGGSGITPMLSIIREVASRRGGTHISKIHLIYSVKRSEDLSMLSPISSLLLRRETRPGRLKLKAFVTREEGSERKSNQILQQVFQMEALSFKPKSPLNSARRPDGLLQKAVIVGLSSLIFLAILIMLTHIFIPTNKKGSSKQRNYPSWINCLLVMTSFVAATVSTILGAVLLRVMEKKDRAEISRELAESNHLISGELTGEREEHEHEVHFGTRPNLAALLEDLSAQLGKSKVGVFVCGPRAMEEPVAIFCSNNSAPLFGNICSKVEKPHFDFHSLSFSI